MVQSELWAIIDNWIPVAFAAGGMYAVFKWRLNKVEAAVEKMAQACITNRQTCNGDLGHKLDVIRREANESFKESAQDRKDLREEVTEMKVMIARLDQKQQNGVH